MESLKLNPSTRDALSRVNDKLKELGHEVGGFYEPYEIPNLIKLKHLLYASYILLNSDLKR